MTKFRTPKTSFATLDATAVSNLVASAADVALVLDTAGAIQDVFVHDAELQARLGLDDNWVGQDWRGKLNSASRSRAGALISDAFAGKPARWRHLNHAGQDGADVPVLYAAAPIRSRDRVVVFGRDLRPQALMQQRLIDAQDIMEQDRLRIQSLEVRSRLLLGSAPDAILVLNLATQRITEANAAMQSMIGHRDDLVGLPASDLFDAASQPGLATMLAASRGPGAVDAAAAGPLQLRLANATSVSMRATSFREDGAQLVMLRAVAAANPPSRKARPPAPDESALVQLVENAPDGFVVTDHRGVVLAANAAFLAMVELNQARDAVGQSLDQWLGRSGVDLDLLLKNLRQRSTVRLFATTLAGASGTVHAAELSAVALQGDNFGFAIRNVERRVADSRPGRETPRSVDQLTELIGRVPLKELVREATDMIERLCIETALEMTSDNRASAAELLGLSRQSLYVKLRRYDLGDLTDEPV